MIPDLGRYAVTVLTAYGVALALIAGLVGVSLWQARRAARALESQKRSRRRADGV